MQLPKLKVLIEAGAVREAEAMADGDGWAVWIVHATRGGERREPLERQRGGARVFATLGAVARCLAAVGLGGFAVNLPGKGEELP